MRHSIWAACSAGEGYEVQGGLPHFQGRDQGHFVDELRAKGILKGKPGEVSAAVVQVAYANQVPVIVFRSLSDLAGGDAGANQMTTFMALASVNSADVVRAFVAALPD